MHVSFLYSYMGSTLTKAVSFLECLKVINQYAFVASQYPVIITIENHLPPHLQKEAAKVGFAIFNKKLNACINVASVLPGW